jgi:colicin import membrane protein
MVLAATRTPPEPPVVQAELWSSLPPLQPATASPASPQTSEPPPQQPTNAPTVSLPDPGPTPAEIALEKKKAEEQQREKEAQERAERERLAREKEAQEKAAAEKAARDKVAKERAEKEKQELAEAERQAKIAREEAARELKKREQDERLAKKRAEDEKRRQEAKLQKAIEAQRREEEEAVLKQFGANLKAKAADAGRDAVSKTGTADGAAKGDRSGAAATWLQRVRGVIESRVSFRGDNTSDLILTVQISSTGEIGSLVIKSPSNNPRYDEAVKRAINQVKSSGGVPAPPQGLDTREVEIILRHRDKK